MVPAKTQCPTDWTVEYVGYLMSEDRSVYHTTYMNVLTESVPGLNVQSLPTAYFALVEVCPVLHMMMRKSVVCTR